MNRFVVVDASLAFKWLVPEENSDKARELARSWGSEGDPTRSTASDAGGGGQCPSPTRDPDELTLQDATRLMENLLGTGISLREMPRLHGRALELAYNLLQGAVYDAHYLALAEMLGCELWTADERFYRASGPSAGNVRWLGEVDSAGGME